MPHLHLAIDLGAESGRVMAVWLNDQGAALHEAYRFTHQPIKLPSGWHWNITGLWQSVLHGLQAAQQWAKGAGHVVRSVGVDTWGVDWGLLDPRGELVGLPHAYRDPRNEEAFRQVVERVGSAAMYEISGIQLLPLNTLYSLYAMAQASPSLLDSAHRLVFIPDLLHFWLSGVIANERTIASTSQMLDWRTGQWSSALLGALELPDHLFGPLVEPGTVLGPIRAEIVQVTGLAADVQVVAPGSHDTASAVASVPTAGDRPWAFLSSGTWSLLGAERSEVCANEEARQANFTNEAGVGGTIRLLKNIAGLWLVQECRQAWAAQGREWSYAELTEAARGAPAWQTWIDPDDPRFYQPGDMPGKIEAFARETDQPPPREPGQFVRCCLESLAWAYRRTLGALERLVGARVERMHLVGGGSQNSLLNQLTADLCECDVMAGPVEATALGNGLVQAMACGELSDLRELRERVRRDPKVARVYRPQPIIQKMNSSGKFFEKVANLR